MKNLSELKIEKYAPFPGMKELVTSMCRTVKVMSWGASGFTNFMGKFLMFTVQGHHFKGWICIGVNALDLFDVYLVDKDQNIIHELNHVYVDELIDQIDAKVERIQAYKC